MNQKKTKRVHHILMKTAAFLVSVTMLFSMTTAVLATNYTENAGLDNNGKFASEFSGLEEVLAAADELHEEIAGEGIVLLKNEDGALPMSGNERITAFNLPETMQTTLTQNGFSVNPNSTTTILNAKEDYSQAEMDSFRMFSDAAIIYLYREGGEGEDLSVGNDGRAGSPSDETGGGYNSYGAVLYNENGQEVSPSGEAYGWNHENLAPADAQILISPDAEQNTEPVRHELMLTYNEERMIEKIKDMGFDKIIVLIDTSHVMEIYNLDQDPAISAILWVGHQISSAEDTSRAGGSGDVMGPPDGFPGEGTPDMGAGDGEMTPPDGFSAEGAPDMEAGDGEMTPPDGFSMEGTPDMEAGDGEMTPPDGFSAEGAPDMEAGDGEMTPPDDASEESIPDFGGEGAPDFGGADAPNFEAIGSVGTSSGDDADFYSPGQTAIAKILKGEINPSGKTVDEWYRDFTADPTWQNFGMNTQMDSGNLYRYSDGTANGNYVTGGTNGPGNYGLDYEEGIYLGYKYYETYWYESTQGNTAVAPEDADQWWEDNVVYPFGYGLSYTQFRFEIQGIYTDAAMKNNIAGSTLSGDIFASAEGLEAEVEALYIPVLVTNTGDCSGKEVVQIYVSTPYYSGEIEKSFVTLSGYAKSDELAPGDSQVVVVEVNVQDFSSFDYNDANDNGNAGYELDEGEYIVRAMNNSHVDETSEGYSAASFTLKDKVNLILDDYSGNVITPIFSDPDSRYYTIRDNSGEFQVNADPSDSMTILSRADLDGTFPKAPTYGDLTASDAYMDEITRDQLGYQAGASRPRSDTGLTVNADGTEQGLNYDYIDDSSDPWYKTPEELSTLMEGWTQRSTADNPDGDEDPTETPLSDNPEDWLDSMAGVPLYIDGEVNPQWTEYMNKLTWNELCYTVSTGGFPGTAELGYIGKNLGTDNDSPISYASHNWGDCNIVTATYNTELARRQGEIIGELALYQDPTGWYGPGINIHRSPFSGRNAEYYGQDGLQAGLIAAAVVSGAESKGLNCYVKHVFLNDQESYRSMTGIATWVTEQAIRECYGVTAQKAMQEGGASSCMLGFNRIGSAPTIANYNFTTQLLREQWGWTGSIATDAYRESSINGYNVPSTPQTMFDANFVTADGSKVTEYDTSKNWNDRMPSLNEVSGNMTIGHVATTDLMVRCGTDMPLVNLNLSMIGGQHATPSGRWNPDLNAGAGGVYLEAEGSTMETTEVTVTAQHQYYYVRMAAMRLLYQAVNSMSQKNGFYADSGYGGWANTADTSQAITLGLGQDVSEDVSISAQTLNGSTVYAYTITSGELPEGLTLDSQTGLISGTPTGLVEGCEVTITANVDGWLNAQRYLTVNVSEPVPGQESDPGANTTQSDNYTPYIIGCVIAVAVVAAAVVAVVLVRKNSKKK